MPTIKNTEATAEASHYVSLGNANRRASDYDQARIAYQKALAIDPDHAVAHCNLGILYMALSQEENAVLHLKKALMIHPELLPAASQLGDYYLRHEQYAEARDIFLKATTQLPENSDYHHRLGIAYYKLRDFEKAKIAFEHVLMLDYQHPEINQYLANTLLEMGDHEKAMHYYFHQLERNPWFETFYNIGVLYMIKERLKEALVYFDKAIQLNPEDLATQLNMAYIYLKRNQRIEAIAAYEKIHQRKPQDPEIQHILTALKQDHTPRHSPPEYITHLFDQYALHYDSHLTKVLGYDVPQKIFQTLQLEYPHFTEKKWNIMDLGCGTGLCGALFKPFSSVLTGVDLSENMLAIAKQKQIYDELILDDITAALPRFSAIDLIIAADVLTYCGDLTMLFDAASKALAKEGLFIFTVEKTYEKDFILQSSIRYAHNKQYLETLAALHAFDILRFETIQLRWQQNEPVEGYLVFLKTRANELTEKPSYIKI